jgi:hypothetical protein
MMFIDCAGDDKIVLELENYLKNLGFSTKTDESTVIVNEDIKEEILNYFLKDTNRSAYDIRKIDSTNFLLSKEIPIEDFGLFKCEMCEHIVSSEEELLVHRRTHGI